jgi:DnaJ-class molecular chaperone
MSTMNYYVVLGIGEDADEDTVRSAFRALARRYHPDAGAGSSAVEFQRAREAYETLGDRERRRLYDRQLRASRVQPVIVREPVLSRPLAEPLFGWRQPSVRFPRTRVAITRTAFFEEVFEELFVSLDDDWFWQRRWSAPPRTNLIRWH